MVLDEAETSLPSDVDASSSLAREASSRLDLTPLLDDESAQAFPDVVRRELGKDLVSAVKRGGENCIPKPSCPG